MPSSQRKPSERFLSARLPAETASGEYAPVSFSSRYRERNSAFIPWASARRSSFLESCSRSGSTTCICSARNASGGDRKSTRLNSSHEWISYAVFCLKKKKKIRCSTHHL